MKLRHIAFANDDWYYCREFRSLIKQAACAAGESVSGDYHDYADVMDEFQRNWCEHVNTLWSALRTLSKRLEFSATYPTNHGGAIELVPEYQQSVGIGAIYAGHNQKMSRLCDDALDAAIAATVVFAIKVVERLAGQKPPAKLLHIEFRRDDWYSCREFNKLIELAAYIARESVSGDYHDYADVMDEFQRNWCEHVNTLWTATGSGGAIELVTVYQQDVGIGAIYAGHDQEMSRLCDDALDAAIAATVVFAIKVVKHLAEQAATDRVTMAEDAALTATATNPKNPAKKRTK